jgi:hypothetical protein
MEEVIRAARLSQMQILGLVALAIILLEVVIPHEGVWVVDTGLRYLMLVNIVDRHHFGGFWLDYPLKHLDPGYKFVPFGVIQTFVFGDRLFAQYPPWFVYATAPFYAALGKAGLRILPVAMGLVLLWGVARLAQLCGMRRYATAATIAVVGTPIFPYIFIYWDIIPALAFGVWGLVLLLEAERRNSVPIALGAGFVLWLAFLMREEYMLWAGCCLGPMLLNRTSRRYAFAAGAIFAPLLGMMLLINKQLIGVPLFFQATTGSGIKWEYTWSWSSRWWVIYFYLGYIRGLWFTGPLLFLAIGAVAFLPWVKRCSHQVILLGLCVFAAVILRCLVWDFHKPIANQHHLSSLVVASPIAFAGLFALRLRDDSCSAEQRSAFQLAVLSALLFLGVTLALSVPSSAVGLNFGPRLMLPIYPGLTLGALSVLSQGVRACSGQARRVFVALSAVLIFIGFADSLIYVQRLTLQYKQIARLEKFFENLEPGLPIATEKGWFVTMFPYLFYKRPILPAWSGDEMIQVYQLLQRLSPEGFIYVAERSHRTRRDHPTSKLEEISIPPESRPIDPAFEFYLYRVRP